MYFLFGFDHYYPGGGMEDYIDGFDDIEDAKKEAQNHPCDVYEIAVRRDGDLVNPPRLETVLTGYRKRIMRELIIVWQK